MTNPIDEPQKPLSISEMRKLKFMEGLTFVREKQEGSGLQDMWLLVLPSIETGMNHYLALNQIADKTFEETNELTQNTYTNAVAEHGAEMVKNEALKYVQLILNQELFENLTEVQAFEAIWFIKHFFDFENAGLEDKFVEVFPESKVIFADVNFVQAPMPEAAEQTEE
ncbi:hypothetical protein VB319_25750 [Vibrio parahaemolyticus]|uniref:Uncharacterized protein n=1 Tax=Vibrio vulnificus TaxID=672 RepID=A0AAN1UF08_VIBVL|nr:MULTISPECIES: hypothetical protein [Vibrio]AXX63056.1 hypothetical protein FORC53_4717 [Vibrio vulnificus]MEA5357337.1 hypothetical protein [Vibrio parahaemolyticus]